MLKRFLCSVFALLLLAGCAAPTPAPTATPLPSPTVTVTPTPNLPQVITLIYGTNAQYEIISPAGTRIMFDVTDPSKLSSPPTTKDILLTTHGHLDHYSPAFSKSFPGQQLNFREGTIDLPDVKIRSIASAHYPTDKITAENATNYILIVDMGGLRIAHFGDIGQDKLTDEQLKALGTVDIAITQLDNSFSDMNVTNEKGINLMNQVKPKVIIPTHMSLPSVTLAMKNWKGLVHTDASALKISRADLPSETSILIFGILATSYQKIFKLPTW